MILGALTSLGDGNSSDGISFYASESVRYLGISIDGGQEIVPRHQLAPSFHASTAEVANGVEPWAVTRAMIAVGAVDSEAIGDGAVAGTGLTIAAGTRITSANVDPAAIQSALLSQVPGERIVAASIEDAVVESRHLSIEVEALTAPVGAVMPFALPSCLTAWTD